MATPTSMLGRLASSVVDIQHQLDSAYLDELRRWSSQREQLSDPVLLSLMDGLVPQHTRVSSFEVECGFEATMSTRVSGRLGLSVLGRTVVGYEAARANVTRNACRISVRVEVAPMLDRTRHE